MTKLIIFLCCISTFIGKAPIFVAIAGGTGSGKTTLAERIHKAFPNSVLISQDSYYKDITHLPIHERAQTNFDHPNSLDFSLMRQHLISLRDGIGFEQPTYSFHTHSRLAETKWIEPSPIVIIEGILILAIPELRELFDIKIFVDTDDDVRVLRRIERDLVERSRDFKSVKEQYLKTVKPMHTAFVEPSKKFADVIIPEGGHNQVAISLILAKLSGAY